MWWLLVKVHSQYDTLKYHHFIASDPEENAKPKMFTLSIKIYH